MINIKNNSNNNRNNNIKSIKYNIAKVLIILILIQTILMLYTNNTHADDDKLDITYTATQPTPGGTASSLSSSNEYGLEGPGVLVKTPLFQQWDPKWGNMPYGPHFSIAEGGCGITSAAMVISGLTQTQVEPPELAQKYGNKYTDVHGSTDELFPAVARDYGLNLKLTPATSTNVLIEHLKNGGLAIANMGPPTFTSGGHFIVLKGVNPDGKIYVNDPSSRERSNQLWDPDIFVRERKFPNTQFYLYSK